MEATKFVLSRLGRNDGYGDQPIIAVEVNTDEKRAQIRALFGINQEDKDNGTIQDTAHS